MSSRGHDAVLVGTLAALTVALGFGALFIGYVPLDVAEVLTGLVGMGDPRIAIIVQEVRLPRIILAGLIGASLALSGACLQGLFRNPLADPGVIGVSASASLGAVVMLYFGMSAVVPLALPAGAMAGALTATLILYLLAVRDASTLTLILAGVAISGFAVGLTSLALNLSPNPFAVAEIVTWLLGSVRDRSFHDLTLVLPFMLAGGMMLLAVGRGLDGLTLGEDTARSLGIELRRLRLLVILGTTLAVGAGVSVSGGIGFVGLVVPHLIRPLVGHQPSRLLVPSAFAGAALLVAADLTVRLVPVEPELMLGVVTALIGTPFFFYLVVRMGRSAAP